MPALYGGITAATLKKVVDTTSGALVDQVLPAGNNDNAYITRADPATTPSIQVTGSYTSTSTAYAPSGSGISTYAVVVLGASGSGSEYGKYVDLASKRTSAGTKAFTITIPGSALPAGGKVYVSVYMYLVDPGEAPLDGSTGGANADYIRNTFITNRPPNAPVLTSPSSGLTLVSGDADHAIMAWDTDDPDKVGAANTPLLEDYGGYQVQYRVAPSGSDPNPPWQDPTLWQWSDHAEPAPCAARIGDTSMNWFSRRAWTLRVDQLFWENEFTTEKKSIKIVATDNADPVDADYKVMRLNPGQWQVRVRTFDRSAADGPRSSPDEVPSTCFASPELVPTTSVSPWSAPVSIYVIGNTLPPILVNPSYNTAVYDDITFSWLFQTPNPARHQSRYYIYAREVGSPTWTLIVTSAYLPGGSSVRDHTFVNGTGGFTFLPAHHYEWAMITWDGPGLPNQSDLSQPQSFWYVEAPESGPELPIPGSTVPDAGLGCGHNRVFVYRRGGTMPMGEITQITKVTWGRIRDDISSTDVVVNDWSSDCGQLLAGLRSWQHELVVFRDNGNGPPKRVWEGPITRLSYEKDTVSIEAKDVMGYVYRRILRQGYNDAYRKIGGVVHGLTTVTNRARQIIQNALAYDDPNVLAYMWVLSRADDAKQSRVVPDWSRTAWQDVDDMSAKSGLDYTTVGRRIMLWDTHNPVGTLPEMRDGDFDTSPIVTEYGMQMANVYGVTNNNGVYGYAERQPPDFYGYVEMLVSAWGESDENGTPETLTAEAAAALAEALTGQAERGITQRWPTPLVVRVPDNSTLSPSLDISINQLIPGVFIPLRSDVTLRAVHQMQKLDSIKVTEDKNGEKITATLSPAPVSRDYDPDTGGVGE